MRLPLSLLFAVLTCQPCATAEEVDFVRDVRPILVQRCYACHGAERQRSGLRLDVKSAAFKGGDGYGASIVPHKSDESPLVELVTADADAGRMPPEGEPLTAAEIRTLRNWIDAGAVWPDGVDLVTLEDRRDHWSFKPVRKVTPPSNASGDWSRTPVDNFIRERLSTANLAPAPEATPGTWLRRVTLDLTGLPPTPEELAEFRADHERRGEAAFRSVVDRLLASPRYGERWAQHWLDVVRYADTHGFEVNTERANAWPYRDYVIEAFNNDTPYDQFVREQLAGDAHGADAATGFLVTASVLLPGQIGKDDASKRLARQDAVDEIVTNVGQSFLGLTIGCARCHDHKFDPITARDYYAMQAFVAGVEYGEREVDRPDPESLQPTLAPLRKQLAYVERRLAELADADGDAERTRVVTGGRHDERFGPRDVKVVRFTIHASDPHPTLGVIEPCIDEFEIFTAEDEPRNVALASAGAQVTASGSRTSGRHRLEHVNDGQYGNDRSWMSDTPGTGQLTFTLPQVTRVSGVAWSRDREGRFGDRLATAYTLEVGTSLDALTVVAHLPPTRSEAQQQLSKQRDELRKRIAAAQAGRKIFAGTFRTPDDIHLLRRGDHEQPAERVTPSVPDVFGDIDFSSAEDEQARRVALADWVASPQHPLTARVMVNRVWQWHFGVGLVDTPNDFGRNGTAPSHLELLDWLAAEFVRSGWSVKQLHRLIVLSSTYRQSSAHDANAASVDAGGRLLWRFPSRRLEAEAIRNAMLFVSGRLDLSTGGRGFDLFNKRGGLTGFVPVERLGPEHRRRMVYAHKVRRERDGVFGAFDCPDAGQSTPRRRASTTPIQALNLFNSRVTLDESDAFARRVHGEVGEDIRSGIVRAYELALGRRPTAAEVADAEPVVRAFGLATLCRVLFNSNEFLFLP